MNTREVDRSDDLHQVPSIKVLLNRTALRLGADDALPMMRAQATAIGNVAFAPVSITFLAAPLAQNQSCS